MTAKRTLTPKETEATKAEVSRRFAVMLEEDPDRAVAVWLELAGGIMGVLQRRADVRAVEGRSLSAKDQAAVMQLRTDIAKVMEATDPERVAEARLERLDGVALHSSHGSA